MISARSPSLKHPEESLPLFLSPCPGNASENSERTRIALCPVQKQKTERTIAMINILNKTTGRRILAKIKGALFSPLIAAALALPLITQAEQQAKKGHSRYKLVDLGTLGGPGSRLEDYSKVLNNAGTVVGEADTADPASQHAFKWQNGVLVDLGVLPGGSYSHPFRINDAG